MNLTHPRYDGYQKFIEQDSLYRKLIIEIAPEFLTKDDMIEKALYGIQVLQSNDKSTEHQLALVTSLRKLSSSE